MSAQNTEKRADGSQPAPTQPVANSNAARICILQGTKCVGISAEEEVFYNGFSQAQRTRVRNKIDRRLLPVLCILYLFAHLDRANIGNAKIEGLKDDANMNDRQYNLVLCLFFVPYCLLEVPSNMILKRLQRPSRYLCAITILWGLMMTCHGFARDFKDLAILRFLLGVTESGFYPAALWLCSTWYQKDELAFRFSILIGISAAAGMTSGLLAAGIARMDGILKYEGWRWLFIVEGLVTVLLGLGTAFLLVDTPALSKAWLTEDEIRYLEIQNMVKEGGRTGTPAKGSTMRDLKLVVTNWRLWGIGLILHAGQACSAGMKFTIPTIIRGLGYDKGTAQLLSAVPYLFGVVSALSFGISSDKLTLRSPFIVVSFCLMIVGFSIVISQSPTIGRTGVDGLSDNVKHAILAGLCIVVSGMFPIGPTGGSWIANNIASSGRRAVALAFVMAVGSLGGLTGSFLYEGSQGPAFLLGYAVSLGCAVAGVVLTLVLVLAYLLSNKRKSMLSEEGATERYSDAELTQMGEASPFFKYTL